MSVTACDRTRCGWLLPTLPWIAVFGLSAPWGAGCGLSDSSERAGEPPPVDPTPALDARAPLDAGRLAPPRDAAVVIPPDAGGLRDGALDGDTPATSTPAPIGAVCVSHADCSASSLCYEVGTHGMCTRLCEEDAQCPGGEACLHWGEAQVCMPRCDTADSQCAGTMVCVLVDAEDEEAPGLCLPPCDEGGDCHEDAECVLDEHSGRHVCVPHGGSGGGESPPRTCHFWGGRCW